MTNPLLCKDANNGLEWSPPPAVVLPTKVANPLSLQNAAMLSADEYVCLSINKYLSPSNSMGSTGLADLILSHE